MPTDKEIAKLVITLEAQLKDFKSQLTDAKKVINDFAGVADDSLKKADKSANTFMSTLKGFIGAQAILGAIRKGFNELKQIMVESTVAYRNQQNALASLRAALGYIPPELVKQATALQNLTGIADDQINLAQAAVGAWIKETDAIKRVTEAAIDFGRAKRIDVVSAAELLTKSIVSETNALGRYGIKVDAAVGTSERLEQVINGVNRAYKGWAEELGRTDVGQIEIVKAAMSDVKETIGERLIPLQLEWNKAILAGLNLLTRLFNIKPNTIESFTDQLSIMEEKLKETFNIDDTSTKALQDRIAILEKTATTANSRTIDEIALMYKVLELRKSIADEELKLEDNKNQNLRNRMGEQSKVYFDSERKKLENLKKAKSEEKKIIETSLTVFQAQLKQILQDIETQYKEGSITAEKYYQDLRNAADWAIRNEIKALEDLLPQLKDKNQIDETNNKIAAKKIELQTKISEINVQETETTKKDNEEKQKQIDLIEELEKKIEARRLGTSSLGGIAGIEADIESKQKEEDAFILEHTKDRIEQEKLLEKSHIAWKAEQSRRISEYENEQRQKDLESIAASFGQITGIMEGFYNQRLQIVNNLEQAVQNAEQAGDTAKAARLRKQLEESKAAARQQFYIAKSLALAEAIMNAAVATTRSYSDLGPIAGTVAAIAVGAANAIAIGTILGQMIAGPGFEHGGEVEGQSGRDAIRARLTRGEFVEPVDTVQHYGAGVMEALRTRSIPRSLLEPFSGHSPRRSSYAFAEGGLATSEGKELSLQVNNIVNPALMGDYLSSRAGQSLILNVISQNSYEVRRRISI